MSSARVSTAAAEVNSGIAANHHAGSDNTPSLLNANSDNAVSQYDVACYQQFINGNIHQRV